MTDIPGGTPPFGSFPGFPGFSQQDMMEKMWDLMRLNPFAAAAIPGGAQGMGPSLSMMSDMLAPLASIEEIDKRVTDMRAVEQWLKLNLNMLQSAIQALEVQGATLATLRAFGAYAQTSVEKAQAPAEKPKAPPGWPMNKPEQKEAPKAAEEPARAADRPEEPKTSGEASGNEVTFDPSGWWNVLQTQFNQLASLAMTQPAGMVAPTPAQAAAGGAKEEKAGEPKRAAVAKKAPARKPAAKKKPE